MKKLDKAQLDTVSGGWNFFEDVVVTSLTFGTYPYIKKGFQALNKATNEAFKKLHEVIGT